MSSELDQAFTKFGELINQRDQINRTINEFEKYLLSLCPVKIGDTVKTNGYSSFAGKDIIVNHIQFVNFRTSKYDIFGQFICVGRVLKKSGQPSESMRGQHIIMVRKKGDSKTTLYEE